MLRRMIQLLRIGDLLRVGPATIELYKVTDRKASLCLNMPGHVILGPFAPGEAETFDRLRVKVTSTAADRCRLRILFPDCWLVALVPKDERSSHVRYEGRAHRGAGQSPNGDTGDMEDR